MVITKVEIIKLRIACSLLSDKCNDCLKQITYIE